MARTHLEMRTPNGGNAQQALAGGDRRRQDRRKAGPDIAHGAAHGAGVGGSHCCVGWLV
jgi:hypothetical protein